MWYLFVQNYKQALGRSELDTAMRVTNTLVTKYSYIPLLTRLVDIMTNEIKNEYI